MVGGWGNDSLFGNAGDDVLVGNRGNDLLDGGAGRDQAFGGAGNDRIVGDLQDYFLAGQTGTDLVTFSKVDPSAQPIFLVSLYSKSLPIYKVDQYARSVLAPQISTLDGVAQVNIFGSAKYAVRIQADPNALAARQL
jgi:Ca2+-binding RTX toxin-like protein